MDAWSVKSAPAMLDYRGCWPAAAGAAAARCAWPTTRRPHLACTGGSTAMSTSTPQQAPSVRAMRLADWFAWHRATQLPDYAGLLAMAQLQVLHDVTPGEVCRWADELRKRIERELRTGAASDGRDRAHAQARSRWRRVERRYRKADGEFRDEFLQPTRAEQLDESNKRAVARAELIYGRLERCAARAVGTGRRRVAVRSRALARRAPGAAARDVETMRACRPNAPTGAHRGGAAPVRRPRGTVAAACVSRVPTAVVRLQLRTHRAPAQQHQSRAAAARRGQTQGLGRRPAGVGRQRGPADRREVSLAPAALGAVRASAAR